METYVVLLCLTCWWVSGGHLEDATPQTEQSPQQLAHHSLDDALNEELQGGTQLDT